MYCIVVGSCSKGRRNARNDCTHGSKRRWHRLPVSKVWLH